jgi:hypothetical protein
MANLKRGCFVTIVCRLFRDVERTLEAEIEDNGHVGSVGKRYGGVGKR